MNEAPAPVFVYGAGGHAKVVIDLVERAGRWRVAFLIDELMPAPRELLGRSVAGGHAALLARRGEIRGGIVAIGDNAARLAAAAWLRDHGFALVSAAHPGAWIGREVEIAAGTVLMAGAVVNSGSRLGENVIINTGATVDHDCVIGDGVHIAPGVNLCGGVRVGRGALVGVGAVAIPGVSIGAGAQVGAGAVVVQDVPDGARVAGNPARALGDQG